MMRKMAMDFFILNQFRSDPSGFFLAFLCNYQKRKRCITDHHRFFALILLTFSSANHEVFDDKVLQLAMRYMCVILLLQKSYFIYFFLVWRSGLV